MHNPSDMLFNADMSLAFSLRERQYQKIARAPATSEPIASEMKYQPC